MYNMNDEVFHWITYIGIYVMRQRRMGLATCCIEIIQVFTGAVLDRFEV